jgi:hypothetical protein
MKLFLHRNPDIGVKKPASHLLSCCTSVDPKTSQPEPLKACRFRSSPAVAIGALALGAFAVGALAIGTLAIGRLFLGKLSIGSASIKKLEIDELIVAHSASGNKVIQQRGSDEEPG